MKRKKAGRAKDALIKSLDMGQMSYGENSFKSRVTGSFADQKVFLIIILVSFAVYFNALFNGFVFDDISQIVKNPWVKDIRYLPDIFFENVWGFVGENSNYYRPLMHVIYLLGYHLFGLAPWGFHLINVVFHAGISVMVYLTISRLLKESQGTLSRWYHSSAFWASLLFATHPIHTEVVTAIMGIPDLSFAFFYLLAFYSHIRAEGKMRGTYLISVLSFFVAILCKEPAVTLPIILFAYDYFSNGKKSRSLGNLMNYVPYAAMAGIYMMMRFVALGGLVTASRHTDLSRYEYLINALPLFRLYLEKLFLPTQLNFLHTFHPIRSILEMNGILSLAIAVLFGGGVWMALRKSRVAFLGLLLIALPLLPALHIPALNQELENAFAERYLYLPSYGFVLLFASLFQFGVNRWRRSILLFVAVAFVAGLYSIGTIYRNTFWKDNYVLSEDTVRKSPDSAFSHLYLGYALFYDRGDLDRAIDEYELSLKLKPDNEDAHNKLGIVYQRKGLIDKAIEHHLVALKLNPDFGRAHNNLGLDYFMKGLNEKAIEHYLFALRLNPKFIEAHNNLGLAYYRTGRVKEAMDQYQIALFYDPNFPNAHNNMGVAYGEAGSVDKAIWHFEKALSLDPNDRNAQRNLAKAYDTKRRVSTFSLPSPEGAPQQ